MFSDIKSWYSSIPKDIKIISFATGIRWIGWGFADPLIAVFLFSILGSYAQAGLVEATGGLVFFLTLPLWGILADRIPLKTFLIIGLAFFFLDGFYVVAAITGAALLAVVGSIFDGMAVASDVVGRSTYVRRHAPSKIIGSVAGFQDTLINIGWVAGAIINVVAVNYLSLPWVFFMVLPTNLVALLIISFYLPYRPNLTISSSTNITLKNYWKIWKDIFGWNKELRLLAGLTFLFYALGSIGNFIVPIYAYTGGASLSIVILIKIAVIAPVLFSAMLGRIADTFSQKAFSWGLVIVGIIVLPLTFTEDYRGLLVINFLLGIVLVSLNLFVERLVTEQIFTDYFGRASAIFEGLKNSAGYIGAIGLGLLIDGFGPINLFTFLSIFSFILALWLRRRYVFQKISVN